jgi:hypothetical protein
MQKVRDTVVGLMPVIMPHIPKPAVIIAVILAFLFGLIWAYGLDRTIYYNGDPSQLEQSWQDEIARVLNNWKAEDSSANVQPLLRSIDNPQEIANRLGLSAIQEDAAQVQATAATAPQPNFFANIRPFILGTIVVAIIAIFGQLVYDFYISTLVVEPLMKLFKPKTESDMKTQREVQAIQEAKKAMAAPSQVDAAALSQYGEPVARHMSVYILGRGQFDDSFAIEDSNDMFLGECGATISETIGTGDPEKVTAVEIWLFDKEDFVRTVTKVFATPFAFNDPATRARLEAKGELVLVQPGAVLTLETSVLRLQARIVSMEFGTGPLPPESYFERLTIELAAWQKAPGSAPAAAPVAPAPAPAGLPSLDSYEIDYTTSPVAPPPSSPPPAQARPFGGGSVPPIQPLPPRQPSPPPSAPQRPSIPPDDDPFGGTGDFTPIS